MLQNAWSTNLRVITAEEPDPHWINQARDLQVILAAAWFACCAKEDTLCIDGSQDDYEAIYSDLLMVDYSRDESFRVVCSLDTYRRCSRETLSQLAIFLSKRSAIELEDAERRNPAPQAPIPG